jgi:hypothetical protein
MRAGVRKSGIKETPKVKVHVQVILDGTGSSKLEDGVENFAASVGLNRRCGWAGGDEISSGGFS